jgi:hypothetical protein
MIGELDIHHIVGTGERARWKPREMGTAARLRVPADQPDSAVGALAEQPFVDSSLR